MALDVEGIVDGGVRRGPFKPDPAHDDLWNRGAYVVEGIGHCGACHTPRNMFGAEKRNEAFAGGKAEGCRDGRSHGMMRRRAP